MLNDKGTVSAVKQHSTKYGILMNGEWYGGFGQCTVKKGDQVVISYKLNGKYKNITNVEVKEEATVESRDNVVDDIHLQVCLKAAASVLSGSQKTTEDLVSYTKELYTKLWG
jgi:hypothetical protein